MAKVALNLAKLSVNEKLLLGRQITGDMAGNAFFPTPEPTLANVLTTLDEVESAQLAAAGGGPEQTLLLKVKVKSLETQLTQLGNYVEFVSAGDEVKIRSAGMSVKTPSAPVGAMPKPTAFKVVNTESSGQFACAVQAINGAKTYLFQVSTNADDPNSWVIGLVSTRSKGILTGLTSGTKYYTRCAAIGAAGQGPWSDVIQRYAQ